MYLIFLKESNDGHEVTDYSKHYPVFFAEFKCDGVSE